MADPQTDVATHIIELMVITAWADGKVEGQEALTIHRQVAALPMFKSVGNMAEVSKRIRARIVEVGLEPALRETAQGVTATPDRELAFQCCVRVMGADGELQAEEATVLALLQECFKLSGKDVKRLLVTATRG